MLHEFGARAARLFFLIQPIRSLFSGVVVAVAVALAKLPVKKPRRRLWLKRHKIAYAYLTMKNRSFSRFACAILIFIHIAAVLVLSMTWNDPFYNRRREHMMKNSHCFLQTDDINLIPGYLEYILQAKWRGILNWKIITVTGTRSDINFSDDVLAIVDVRSCLSSIFSHSFSRWARPKSSLECVFDFLTEEYETCSRTRSAKEMEDEKHWPGCSRHKCIFIQRYWSQIFVRNCIYMIFHAHWRFKQCTSIFVLPKST